MTVIFLDIDGVLRTFKTDLIYSRLSNKPIDVDKTKRPFCKGAVENINLVYSYTRANIVITSSWRVKYSLDELRYIFRKNGIIAKIIDVTPILSESRGEEIKNWLESNECDNYLVIDDMTSDIDGFIPSDKILKIDPRFGISDKKYFDEILSNLT